MKSTHMISDRDLQFHSGRRLWLSRKIRLSTQCPVVWELSGGLSPLHHSGSLPTLGRNRPGEVRSNILPRERTARARHRCHDMKGVQVSQSTEPRRCQSNQPHLSSIRADGHTEADVAVDIAHAPFCVVLPTSLPRSACIQVYHDKVYYTVAIAEDRY